MADSWVRPPSTATDCDARKKPSPFCCETGATDASEGGPLTLTHKRFHLLPLKFSKRLHADVLQGVVPREARFPRGGGGLEPRWTERHPVLPSSGFAAWGGWGGDPRLHTPTDPPAGRGRSRALRNIVYIQGTDISITLLPPVVHGAVTENNVGSHVKSGNLISNVCNQSIQSCACITQCSQNCLLGETLEDSWGYRSCKGLPEPQPPGCPPKAGSPIGLSAVACLQASRGLYCGIQVWGVFPPLDCRSHEDRAVCPSSSTRLAPGAVPGTHLVNIHRLKQNLWVWARGGPCWPREFTSPFSFDKSNIFL